MVWDGTLNGLWIVRSDGTPEPLLARVHEELYVLAFTNAGKAGRCSSELGAAGRPFYVCAANLAGVIHELRAAGVRAFIIDYDARRASFTAAHALPRPGELPVEHRRDV